MTFNPYLVGDFSHISYVQKAISWWMALNVEILEVPGTRSLTFDMNSSYHGKPTLPYTVPVKFVLIFDWQNTHFSNKWLCNSTYSTKNGDLGTCKEQHCKETVATETRRKEKVLLRLQVFHVADFTGDYTHCMGQIVDINGESYIWVFWGECCCSSTYPNSPFFILHFKANYCFSKCWSFWDDK